MVWSVTPGCQLVKEVETRTRRTREKGFLFFNFLSSCPVSDSIGKCFTTEKHP